MSFTITKTIFLSIGILFTTNLLAFQNNIRLYENAIERFDKREYAATAIQLKNILQTDPNHLPARILLGRTRLATGDSIGAQKELELARKLGADQTIIAIPLAQTLIAQHKYQLMLDSIDPETYPLPIAAQLYAKRGIAQLELGKLDLALEEFNQSLLIIPDSAQATAGQALIYLRTGAFNKAKDKIEEAMQIAPKNPDVWMVKAALSYATGNLFQAIQSYDKVIAQLPFQHGARIARAGALIDLKRYELAADDLKELYKTASWDPQVGYLLAVALDKMGDVEASKRTLTEASNAVGKVTREVIAEHAPSLMISGLITYSNRQFEESYRYLSEYIKRFPNHIGARKLLASVLMSLGENRKAVDVLKPATLSAAKDDRVFSLLGQAYLGVKQYTKAADAFKDALKLKPGNSALLTQLATARVATGNTSQAIKDLERAVGKDIPVGNASFLLASLHLQYGNPLRSIQICQKMLEQDQGNHTVRNLMASGMVKTNQLADAKKQYNKIIIDNPGFYPAQINLAQLDVLKGNTESAKRRLAYLLKSRPNYIRAMLEMAKLEQTLNNEKAAIRWLEKAHTIDRSHIASNVRYVEILSRKKDYSKALEIALGLKSDHPENHQVNIALAKTYINANKLLQATSLLKKMTADASYDSQKLIEIANLQMHAKAVDDARWSLEKSLVGSPDSLEARTLLILLELGQGKLAQASNHLSQLSTLHPNLPLTHILTGDIAMASSQFKIAEGEYRKAFAQQADSANLLRMVHALSKQQKWAVSIKNMSTWVNQHPDDILVRRSLAETYHRSGQLENARLQYENIVKKGSNDASLLNNLANIYAALKHPDSLKIAKKAWELDPRNINIIDTLGWLYVQSGNFEQGILYLRDAQSRDSSSREIQYHIGVALQALGNATEAKRYYEKALTSGEIFPGYEDAELRLKSMSNK